MRKAMILAITACALACGCKKTRICECKNLSGTYDAGEFEGTKSQAKKYCKGLSEGQTECYLK